MGVVPLGVLDRGVDVVTWWLVALVLVVVAGLVAILWGLTRGRGLAWTMLGLTIAALGGLLVLGWYWAIERHLAG